MRKTYHQAEVVVPEGEEFYYAGDYQEDEPEIRCTVCGLGSHLGDLCDCCHRCIDCVAEIGHRRLRIVADELEEVNDR